MRSKRLGLSIFTLCIFSDFFKWADALVIKSILKKRRKVVSLLLQSVSLEIGSCHHPEPAPLTTLLA